MMSENDCDLDAGTSAEITAEIRDGQLQIVEVSPFDRDDDADKEATKFMQVLDSDGKGLMQLDLLNLTLVKCTDGEDGYRLVANAEPSTDVDQYINDPHSTVTCVLQSSDGDEDQEGADSYVMVEGDLGSDRDQDSYVVVEGEEGPIVFLQSELKLANLGKTKSPEKKSTAPTALELLAKAKAVKKAKALLHESLSVKKGPGRKRTIELPTAHEVLTSPDFKLYLYSCRLCQFKCNAVKELTQHKASCHGASRYKYKRGTGRAPRQLLQCAACPYRAVAPPHLVEHVKSKHSGCTTLPESSETASQVASQLSAEVASALSSQVDDMKSCDYLPDDSAEDYAAPHEDGEECLLAECGDTDGLLFCDVCGLAASSPHDFRRHREHSHQIYTHV